MTTGPSTSIDPYLVPLEPNVRLTSIITSGDQLPSDGVFGGVPDGIGAFDNGDGTMTVVVNHELGSTAGLVRDHGGTGAYIDRLVVDKATLGIVAADDLIKMVMLWDTSSSSYVQATVNFQRFCSGDLPAATALFNSATGLGSQSHIYLTGEETSPSLSSPVGGRPTATIVDGDGAGTTYELARLGNMAYENIVANPFAQNKTVVALSDDETGGEVYIYVGDKQSTGTQIDKAGLTDGLLYGISVAGIADETNAGGLNGTFSLVAVGPNGGDVSSLNGLTIENWSEANGVTGFLRPEDFSWDAQHPDTAYFVTTNSFSGHSRLYQLHFNDISNPTAGGSITAVADSADIGAHMFDNITVNAGHVIIQEDPGGNDYVARVWDYDVASHRLSAVATFNPDQFTPGASQFITNDEESSGVLDVTSLLGDSDTRAYLLDAQVHAATGNPATVENGQLMVMYVDTPQLTGGDGDDKLFGSAADETLTGGNGDDVERSGSGVDSLWGGNGDDKLDAAAGNDTLYGQRGADVLIGGAGNDTLSGGQGGDLFIFDNHAATGSDVITDFSQGDVLLTTVSLGSGRISLESGLALFSGSSVDINNGGNDVHSLRSDGTVSIDGTTYYAYVTGDTGSGASPVQQGAFEHQFMHAGELLF
jgi:Ca2+-binding RTX toxin-like protein